jgi:archaemetzincin
MASSIRYFIPKRVWNGIIGLRGNRISFVLTVLLIGVCFLSVHPSYAAERIHNMSILLVPVGGIDQRVMDRLQGDLGKIFNKQVGIGQGMPPPDYAYNKKRNQYLSTAILKTLMEQKEYMAYGKIIGVVNQDLYVPELNFVFGEAGQKAAVISLARLRQEFHRLPQDQTLFHKRALTEAVHELGHTYGLGHCKNAHCVMFFSNSLMDTDRKGPEFCPECKRKLPSRE